MRVYYNCVNCYDNALGRTVSQIRGYWISNMEKLEVIQARDNNRHIFKPFIVVSFLLFVLMLLQSIFGQFDQSRAKTADANVDTSLSRGLVCCLSSSTMFLPAEWMKADPVVEDTL